MKAVVSVSHLRYQANDYDDNGNLKEPLWFWVAMLWLLCPWWLAAIGVAQKAALAITQVLYPTLIDNRSRVRRSSPISRHSGVSRCRSVWRYAPPFHVKKSG